MQDSDSWSDVSDPKTCDEKSDVDQKSKEEPLHRPNTQQRNLSYKIPFEKYLQEMEDDTKIIGNSGNIV